MLFSHKKECNYVVFKEIDGTGNHHIKQSKPDSERQIPHVLSHMWNLDLKNNPQRT
jgi:hypothetical protein